MFKINRLLYIFIILNGCALYGPSYKKPQLDISNKWSQNDKILIAKESINMSNLAWWGEFHDTDLNQLIESSLENNANIQQAIGNIIQASGNLKQVNLALVPTMNASASYSSIVTLNSNSNNTGATVVGTSLVPSGEWYSLGLIPLYSINLFQQLRLMDSAKASLLSSVYAKDLVRLTVLSQLVSAYFTLLAQKEQLLVTNDLVADLGEQLKIAKLQYNHGYISLFDLQSVISQYYNAKAQVPMIEKNIIVSQNTIKVLLNQPQVNIKDKKLTELTLDYIVPVNIPSNVLKNRPDVLQAETQLIQANAGIGVATSRYFPTFNFNSGIGSSAQHSSSLFGVGKDFWQQQMQITFPFLNLSNLGAIKGAKGVYYTAYYNYVMTVRQAYADADNAIAGYYKALDYTNNITNQYHSNINTYNISNNQYKNGLISYYNLLSNKVSFDNAQILYINSKLQQIQSIIFLYQALGGGYNINNGIKIKKFGDSHDI